MEFDQRPDGRVPLPFTSVDTGMGLERLASVLQQVPSNYDTDLFTPIHARMRELLGHDPDAFEAERFSYQVIADHSRAVDVPRSPTASCRRTRAAATSSAGSSAARSATAGSSAGASRSWRDLAEVVIDIMGEAYPHIVERAGRDPRRDRARGGAVRADARRRHAASSRTALRPLATDARAGRRPRVRRTSRRTRRGLAASVAFRLHDTFGFPIDLTVELAAEYGVAVDRAGLRGGARRAARAESRAGKKAGARAGTPSCPRSTRRSRPAPATRRSSATRRRRPTGRVVAIVRDGMEFDELTGQGAAEVVLDRTPFYAEGGGQVGDRGELREAGGGSSLFAVEDTQKPVGGLIVHARHAPRPAARRRDRRRRSSTPSGAPTRCATTPARTCSTGRCATSSARRARQAGSLVTPDYLRFDFPFDRPLTDRGDPGDRGRGPARSSATTGRSPRAS